MTSRFRMFRLRAVNVVAAAVFAACLIALTWADEAKKEGESTKTSLETLTDATLWSRASQTSNRGLLVGLYVIHTNFCTDATKVIIFP